MSPRMTVYSTTLSKSKLNPRDQELFHTLCEYKVPAEKKYIAQEEHGLI